MRKLSDFQLLAETVLNTTVAKMSFHSDPPLEEVFKQYPQTIVAVSHSTPLSWIPAAATLAIEALKAQGGERIPKGVIDKWFFSNPITAAIGRLVTQSDQHTEFDDLVKQTKEKDFHDLVVFPEGAHCFFGEGKDIKKFRSHRFVELSILTQVPILIVTHSGSEHWGIPVSIPKDFGTFIQPFAPFFGFHIKKGHPINLPIPVGKVSEFRMTAKLWKPSLLAKDLDLDPARRKRQLDFQANKLRKSMLTLAESKIPDIFS